MKTYVRRVRGDVKRKLGDLQGALADLNSAYDLEPNNNFTLRYILSNSFVMSLLALPDNKSRATADRTVEPVYMFLENITKIYY